MIGNLTIVTGENAVHLAKAAELRLGGRYRNPVDPAQSQHVQFMERLGWFIAVHFGRNLIVPEPEPLNLPAAFIRMLDRLRLGYCARVADNFAALTASTPDPSSAPFRAVDFGALGNWRKDSIMLIGDRPGPGWRQPRRPNWPFVSSLPQGCSVWLADELEKAGIPESRLCWMNAFTGAGTPNSAKPVIDAGFSKVIALGRNAALWCEQNDVDFSQVHHPQYWVRSHRNKPYQLIKELL